MQWQKQNKQTNKAKVEAPSSASTWVKEVRKTVEEDKPELTPAGTFLMTQVERLGKDTPGMHSVSEGHK